MNKSWLLSLNKEITNPNEPKIANWKQNKQIIKLGWIIKYYKNNMKTLSHQYLLIHDYMLEIDKIRFLQ